MKFLNLKMLKDFNSMQKIEEWLNVIGWSDWKIEIASSDASFRTYYRLLRDDETLILMDSSLLLDSLPPFVDMNKRLKSVNVQVPTIIKEDLKLGYLILEDFGSTHYEDILDINNYQKLYKKAIDEIIKMQKADISNLPFYDRDFLLFEMDLMQEWYIEKYLNISLLSNQKEIIEKSLKAISTIVLEQPQDIFVHRDFHSRNIMLTQKEEIGIIDFQDARAGAITYDLVSLLKDCYIEWNSEEIEILALYYRDAIGLNIDDALFIKWFDFMGMQRHIKVLGIFARLHLRDGKDSYLKDIPLTLKYLLQTTQKYKETEELNKLLLDLL